MHNGAVTVVLAIEFMHKPVTSENQEEEREPEDEVDHLAMEESSSTASACGPKYDMM